MTRAKINTLWLAVLIFGCGQPASLNQENAKIKDLALIRTISKSYGERLGFSGNILIGQGDEIVYHESFGYEDIEGSIPNTSKTVFRIASLSKQLTAAALLVLEQEGKVDFDQPIAKYLPSLTKDWKDQITIHHLLSHSSGLGRDIESLSSEPLGQDYVSIDDLINIINGSDLLFVPGEKWSYSNLGYTLAAKIIENVTGKTFGSSIEELVFDHLGMENTNHESSKTIYKNKAQGFVKLPGEIIEAKYEDKSYVIGAGSIQSTSEDLFLWAREVMKGSHLTNKSRDKLFTPQQKSYSYGWFVSNYVWPVQGGVEEGLNLHHDGGSPGFSAKISLLKEHDIVVIILSNKLPSPIGEIANKLTNLSVGFDDETIADMDGTDEFFEVLMNNSPSVAIDLKAEWIDSNVDKRAPSNSDILLVGRGYLDNQSYEKAIKVMDYLIEAAPKWTYPVLFKGVALEEQGKIDEALVMYGQVLSMDPQQSNALNRMQMLKEKKR